jgi:hypothetical protein
VQGPVTRGQTALQRMPRSRSATAMARAKLWAASLVGTCSPPSPGGAGHGRASRVGIAGPPPAAIMAGSAAPAIRYTDLTVTACGPSRCWPVVAGKGPQHDHARVAPPLR